MQSCRNGKAFKKGVSQKTCHIQFQMFGFKHNFTGLKTILISFYLLLPAILIGSDHYPEPETTSSTSPSILSGPPSPQESHTNTSPASSLPAGLRPETELDSILMFAIPEVIIEKSRHSFFNEDKKSSVPDSLIRAVFSNSDAGQLLSLFTPAYLNTSGGPGSSSSVFLRGTNSYQTTVNWNGFLLNSLSLGTMDFSLIPVAAVQEISVVHGAAGSIAGSGNFGGSVLLRNSANWHNRLQVSVKSELGTYDNRHHSLSGKIGNERLQYQLLVFTHRAENNFRYTDKFKSGNPVERIQNNSLDNMGVIQNLFLRLPGNNRLETGIWYQARQKEIPAIMGSYLPANTMQRDSSLRVYAKWTKRWSRSSFSLNAAMFDEYMLYRDKSLPADNFYSIDSRIHSNRLLGDVNYRLWIAEYLSVDGGLEVSSLSAEVDAYGRKISENRSAAITALKFNLPGFTGNVSLRKEFIIDIDIPLLFSAGVKKDLPLKGLSLKSSYSDQFRIPSFNDRYWQPGGNRHLLPESGYTADIGLMHQIRTDTDNQLTIEVNAYNSRINNMIQWVPSENASWWRPENRKEVRVRGLESSVGSVGRLGRCGYSLGLGYNFVNSVITGTYNGSSSDEGNQLMYVPLHTGSVRAGFSYLDGFFGFTGNYTGSRHVSNDNNPVYMMPSFMVYNSYAGYRIRMGDLSGQLQLRVMNLFNTRYQVVRSYPMPGRTFHLSFTVDYDYP